MKRVFGMIRAWLLDGIAGVPIDYYLFIVIFFAKISTVLILGGVLNISSAYQHEILLVEKYTYFLVATYIVLYFFVYVVTNHRIPWNRCIFLAVLFFLFAVLTTFINHGSKVMYDYFTKLAIMELMLTAVFMFQVASRLSEEQFWKLITFCGKGFLYLILFMNVISLLVFVIRPASSSISIFGLPIELPTAFFDSYGYRQYYRYAGFYSHPNTCGVHCYLAISLAILLLSRKIIKAPLFLLIVLSSLFLIAICTSRTSIVVLCFMTIYLLVLFLNRKTGSLKKAFMIGLGSLCVAVLILIIIKQERILSIAHDISLDPYNSINLLGSDRLHIVNVVIDMMKTKPLIGHGWNVKILGHDSAHNVFLTVLAWTGIIGFILFVLLLLAVVSKGIETSSIKKRPLLFLIPLCVFVQCMFEQGIVGDARHAYTYLFWLILGYFGRYDDGKIIFSKGVQG